MSDTPYYIALSTEEIDGAPVEYRAVRDEHACACAKFYVDLYKDEDALRHFTALANLENK